MLWRHLQKYIAFMGKVSKLRIKYKADLQSSGETFVEDELRQGHSLNFDDKALKSSVESNPSLQKY